MDYTKISASGVTAIKQFQQREPLHAYLITGAKGIGKATFADYLSCTLFCQSQSKPCKECAGCKSVYSRQNSDITFIQPDGNKQIGVDVIRKMIENVSQYAFGGGYRVVNISPVEMLTPQAQNCLLKSLEAPLANVIFLLLSHDMTAPLRTIASRCASIKLNPWPDDVVRTALVKQGYKSGDIDGVLPVASGNIGRALEMLVEQDQSDELRSYLGKALTVNSDSDVVNLSTSLKEDREGAERFLYFLEQALHQALLVRTGRISAEALSDFPHEWRQSALAAPPEGLVRLIKAVFDTRKLRSGQVNWQSSMDHLLIKIMEERVKWRQS